MHAQIVTIDVRPGHVAGFLTAYRYYVAQSRKEPGCLRFDLHRDRADRNRFLTYEVYTDREALLTHQKTPHHRKCIDTIDSIIEGIGPTITLVPEMVQGV